MALALPFPRLWSSTSIRRPSSDVAARRRARSDAAIDAHLEVRARVDLRHRWVLAVEAAGFGRGVVSPLGGITRAGLPRPVSITPPTYDQPGHLIVTVPTGVLLSDLDDAREELAAGLGVHSVVVSARGTDHARIDLLGVDPLTATVGFEVVPGRIVLGRAEDGSMVTRSPSELTHMVVAGMTGSGKSIFSYSMLAQLHELPTVDLVGADPSGLLLGPLGPHPDGLRVCGTRDAAERYVALLRRLVEIMDQRIAAIPPGHDALPVTVSTPVLVAVFEEAAAVARLTGFSTSKPSEAQRLLSRLHAEGRKARVICLSIYQRAESSVFSTGDRDQCATRLTFRTSDMSTVKMLHGASVSNAQADRLAASLPGTCLAEAPGLPLSRIRAPYLDYPDYCDQVAGPVAA